MPRCLSPDEVEWIREGYQLFRDGDPAFLERYTADARMIIPATLPAGGVYEGAFDALEFWTTIAELEGAHPEPREFIRGGERVVVLGAVHARSRATGEPVAIRFLHAFHVADREAPLRGQPFSSFELVGDTAAFRSAWARDDEPKLPDPRLGQERPAPEGPVVAFGTLNADDLEWMLEGYRLFRDHDPAFMDRYADDAEIVLPESLPNGGTYKGPWELLEFTATVSDLLEDPHPAPEELIRDGDRLVMLGTWQALIPASGRRVAVRVAHVFRLPDADQPLRDQQVQGLEVILDTAAFAAALAEAEER